jgi:hypothetical protein
MFNESVHLSGEGAEVRPTPDLPYSEVEPQNYVDAGKLSQAFPVQKKKRNFFILNDQSTG